ncbi:MAG: hypothetical protein GX649_08325 [Chloroflexi bacterium]|nr:hypothetical protein [Chloroflexota bacterium]
MNEKQAEERPGMEDELGALLATLTPRQMQFVIARLVAASDAEAARLVGLHPHTVYCWRNRADVRRAVRLALREALAGAQDDLLEVAERTLEVLREELGCPASRGPPGLARHGR